VKPHVCIECPKHFRAAAELHLNSSQLLIANSCAVVYMVLEIRSVERGICPIAQSAMTELLLVWCGLPTNSFLLLGFLHQCHFCDRETAQTDIQIHRQTHSSFISYPMLYATAIGPRTNKILKVFWMLKSLLRDVLITWYLALFNLHWMWYSDPQ